MFPSFAAAALVVLDANAEPNNDIISDRARQFSLDQGLDAFAAPAPESRWRTAFNLGLCAPVPAAVKKVAASRGARAASAAQLGKGPLVKPEVAPPTPFPARLGAALAVECARDPKSWSPVYSLRPVASLTVGDAVPNNLSGDTESGLLSLRAGTRAAIYAGPFVLRTHAVAGLDAVPDVAATYVIPELWLGADTGNWWIGGGRQDRWMGPGQHGTLLLSNNATAPWMINGGFDAKLPGGAAKIGRFRGEVGVGALLEPRTDVAEPGLMIMDFRYLPIPEFEIGLSRASIFGGQGRPDVDIGQLLIPSEPHIYEDPDQVLPDQNELAELNLRVNLPLKKRWGIPIDRVGGWWEYGGEDMVVRDIAGVPYPSLAGVANLYGGEIHVRPVTVTIEYAKLMDDYFRWYVGHRVYHEGFQQSNRVTGHFGGPDSETFAGRVTVDIADARLGAWGDYTRRVFVIEARGDRVFSLPTEETVARAGIVADFPWRGAWWTAGYSAASTSGRNYVAGNDVLEHRFVVGMSLGPEVLVPAAR